MEHPGAILVPPGVCDLASIVRPRDASDYATLLGCSLVERWPYQYQLDTITGPGGGKYRFDIWVDEEGRAAGRKVNVCASLAAHPLNEAYGRVIRGPALLVPLGGEGFALSDWTQICGGVWSLDCDSGCDSGCDSSSECSRVSLVEANVRGPTAAKVRIG